MATNPRSQIPLSYQFLGQDGKVTQPWAFFLQTLNDSQSPIGSGYIIDGTAGSVGPTTIFQAPAGTRGTNPTPQSIFVAPDTGQIFTVAGGAWHEQSPQLTGDVTKPAFSNVTTLSNANESIGTFGDSTNIPVITVDAKGRVRSITLTPVVAPPATAAGVNGSVQINAGGLLNSNVNFYYDGEFDILYTPNIHISGEITFDSPTATFNNLSPATVKGDLITNDGTNNVSLPVGEDGQVLIADSTTSTGLRWGNNNPSFIEVPFNYGDASPKLLGVVPANKMVLGASIRIITPFNGTGATLSVGSAGFPDEIINTSDNYPGIASSWGTNPNTIYSVDTNVYLTINAGAGATTGSGLIVLTIQI